MSRFPPALWFFAVVALAGAASRGAQAQTCPLVVDPSGSGHFTDIQPAVDYFRTRLGNLGPCTIEVRAGSYLNSVSFDGVNTGATSDARRLVLRGTRGPGGAYATVLNTGRRDAIRLRSSKFITLQDFDVLTGTNKPFAIEGGAAANRAITVARNDFHDNGGGRDSGCVFVGDSNVDTWIVNNACWNNGSDAVTLGKGGPTYVVNNTIFLNRKSGIVVPKGATAFVANNFVAFNTLTGILLSTSGSGANGDRRLQNNIAYGNAAGDLAGQATATVNSGNRTTATLGAGRLATDFFEDPAAGNFHLAAGSPALDAGISSLGTTPERVPAEDFEGDPRAGSPIDVGLDEVTDADHDGVSDLGDNCPPGLNSSYNPGQGDRDADGVGDYCDNCPKVANPGQEDVTGFNASGSATGFGNLQGDACEVIGESLLQVPAGPASGLTFLATFSALQSTTTVPPDCLTTHFYCSDSSGRRVPGNDHVYARGIPDSLVTFPTGEQETIACPLEDLFVPAGFSDGTYTCRACYGNEHRDLDLREDGTCAAAGGCIDNYLGMTCSAPATLVIDSSIARNGCYNGYWKIHLEQWAATGHSVSEDFDTVFGTDYFDPNVTLQQALARPGDFPNDVARNGTAALLSASHPDVHYPFSVASVIALVREGDPAGLLAAANDLGCPLN